MDEELDRWKRASSARNGDFSRATDALARALPSADPVAVARVMEAVSPYLDHPDPDVVWGAICVLTGRRWDDPRTVPKFINITEADDAGNVLFSKRWTPAVEAKPWEHLRTEETREVERVLLAAGFQRVDAYRFNAASIRVRVIDDRFAGLTLAARILLIEDALASLPERTQVVIIFILPLPPDARFDRPNLGSMVAVFEGME